jgi:hypothetical protein
MSDKKTAKIFGKVVSLPKNTDVVKFMDNIKIPRNKHWYLITEKEIDSEGNQLHLVKYNQEGINTISFVAQLKEHYIKNTTDENMKKMFESIKVVGNDKFSIIKNIPDIEIVDVITENNKSVEVKKTLISKITSDLIKLLRN